MYIYYCMIGRAIRGNILFEIDRICGDMGLALPMGSLQSILSLHKWCSYIAATRATPYILPLRKGQFSNMRKDVIFNTKLNTRNN